MKMLSNFDFKYLYHYDDQNISIGMWQCTVLVKILIRYICQQSVLEYYLDNIGKKLEYKW